MKKLSIIIVFSVLLLVPVGAPNAFAVIFGGIDFLDGTASFVHTEIIYETLFIAGIATNFSVLATLGIVGTVTFVTLFYSAKKRNHKNS